MVYAKVRRNTEPDPPKPIMFSISEVEGVLTFLIESLNNTDLVRRSNLDISFVPDNRFCGGIVFVRREKEECAFSLSLMQREKGGN